MDNYLHTQSQQRSTGVVQVHDIILISVIKYFVILDQSLDRIPAFPLARL